jgi:hypothetical protein
MAFGVGIVIGIPTLAFTFAAPNVVYVHWSLETLSFEPRIASGWPSNLHRHHTRKD